MLPLVLLKGIKMKKTVPEKNENHIDGSRPDFCLLTPWHRAEAVTSYTTPNGLFFCQKERTEGHCSIGGG